jgi:hypothetical protein
MSLIDILRLSLSDQLVLNRTKMVVLVTLESNRKTQTHLAGGLDKTKAYRLMVTERFVLIMLIVCESEKACKGGPAAISLHASSFHSKGECSYHDSRCAANPPTS